jgi:molybdopterin converting factor small subunit
VSVAAQTVTVRYFAGARAAAGTGEEQAPGGLSLDDLLAELGTRHGEPLARILKASSFLVDGVACRDRGVELRAGTTVDVLPPFAGG